MKRIVVVDDDDDVRRLLVMSLSRVGGYEVHAVESGQECLAELARQVPDLVILDVNMPILDGPGTLMQIRDHGRTAEIPVVFLTAGVVDADIARLQALPVAGVLRKPFDPITLPAEVASLLGW